MSVAAVGHICSWPALGRLDVGRVAAGGAGDEEVLTYGRRDHELVVDLAPDGPGLGLHRSHVEAESAEDGQVGVEDGPIRGLHGLAVDVERIGIAHDELTRPEEPETGTGLVPELDLNLVDGQW